MVISPAADHFLRNLPEVWKCHLLIAIWYSYGKKQIKKKTKQNKTGSNILLLVNVSTPEFDKCK